LCASSIACTEARPKPKPPDLNSKSPEEKEEQKIIKGTHDECYGLFTGRKKGSQRPPDTPGIVWVSMTETTLH
jgi:hypothetical protein